MATKLKSNILKLTTFFMTMFCLICAYADSGRVVDVEGATMGEIADRAGNGLKMFYNIISGVLVVVGLYLFATSLVKLININRGIEQGRPMGAAMGMLFASALTSTGVFLFAVTNSLKEVFT